MKFLLNRYLIEGSEGAILHTGDFRAEPWFLESIKRNPFLQPYLAVPEDGEFEETEEAEEVEAGCWSGGGRDPRITGEGEPATGTFRGGVGGQHFGGKSVDRPTKIS